MKARNELIKDFLENISYLSGDEFVLRAICYTNCFLPDEQKADGTALVLLSALSDRQEFMEV